MLRTLLHKLINPLVKNSTLGDDQQRRSGYSPATVFKTGRQDIISLKPLSSLDTHQREAILSPLHSNLMLTGLPGAGKTTCLLHRAHYLIKAYGVSADNFKVLVSGNIARDHLGLMMSQIGLSSESVQTFDGWCCEYYSQINGGEKPFLGFYEPEYERIRGLVLSHLERKPNLQPIYDFVLVDDVQKLNETSLRIIKYIARNVTVSVGYANKINAAIVKESINKIANKEICSYPLPHAYRCCPSVARLAAELIENKADRDNFANEQQDTPISTDLPIIYLARTRKDEIVNLIKVAEKRQKEGYSVGIIVSKQSQVKKFAAILREAEILFEFEHTSSSPNQKAWIKFSNMRIKLLTYDGALGLTFDTVFMPYLETDSMDVKSDDEIKELLFSGITRARKSVYMSVRHTAESPVDRFLSLACDKLLTVQYWKE